MKKNQNENKDIIYDEHREGQLLKSLKNCFQQTLNLYKIMKIAPKFNKNISDVMDYSKSLQKMLKKVVTIVSKQVVSIVEKQKEFEKYEQLKNQYDLMFRQHKNYKCEIDVLQKRLAEVEKSEMQLLRQRNKDRNLTASFQKKVEDIQRQSEENIRKKTKQGSLCGRKHSLPMISSYNNRQKLDVLTIADSPNKVVKTTRLVDHLRKKY